MTAAIAEQAREFDRCIGAIIGEVLLFLGRLIMVLAFMSPAIALNLASLQNRGAIMCGASIVLVFGAAFALHCAMHRRSIGERLFFLILAPVLVFMSMFTAVRNIGGIRETAMEARQAHADAKEDLKTRRSSLEARRKAQVDVAGETGKSVFEEQINEVKRSPLFATSANCNNPTITASIALCKKFSEAKTKLAAAIERDKLQGLLDGLDIKAEAPQVAAPLGVAVSNDALMHMLDKAGFKMDASEIDYSYEAGFVLALELIAAGAPLMFGLVLPDLRRRRRNEQEARTEAPIVLAHGKAPSPIIGPVAAALSPVVASPVLAPVAAVVEAVSVKTGAALTDLAESIRNDTKKSSETRARKKRQDKVAVAFGDVQEWHKERASYRSGAKVQATAAHDDYAIWCNKKSVEPISLPAFGRVLSQLGVEKRKIDGKMFYINLALLSKQAKLAVAVDNTTHPTKEQMASWG